MKQVLFDRVAGVVETKVGYTQGETVNPTYEQICTGSGRVARARFAFLFSHPISSGLREPRLRGRGKGESDV